MTGRLRTMTVSAFLAAILCMIGPVVVPIGMVPVSFTTIGIYLISILVQTKCVFFSVLLYLLMGTLGIPVFSGFSGGLGVLFGPTGGFLWGYLPAALLISVVNKQTRKLKKLNETALNLVNIGIIFLANLILYGVGSLWLSFTLSITLEEAVVIGVLPFIGIDILKGFLIIFLSHKIKKRVIYI